ncbi:MAG: phosphoserine phosphatase SerB [Microbacteriaceae bacterium]
MQKSAPLSAPASFIVVCDVDSTLINQEVIDELAAMLGVGAQVAEITEAAMAGEIDFAESLRQRVRLLKGLSLEAFQQVRSALSFSPGAPELVEAVHNAGGRIFAVSGGFHEVLDGLGAELGLDGWLANRLAIDANGVLSGEVDGPIIDAKAKEHALIAWAAEQELPLKRTIAVGDGANDRDMLRVSGLGVAFDAKAALRSSATFSLPVRDLSLLTPLLPQLRS